MEGAWHWNWFLAASLSPAGQGCLSFALEHNGKSRHFSYPGAMCLPLPEFFAIVFRDPAVDGEAEGA